jgi:hypothetical protein
MADLMMALVRRKKALELVAQKMGPYMLYKDQASVTCLIR